MLNTREEALALLRQYNKEPFHILHALTVEGAMAWYARELGHGEQADFWSMVGLLHDIDFEQWPDQHCQKAPELLRAAGASEELIHAVVSHGYGLCADVKPDPQESASSGCKTLTVRVLQLWEEAQGDLFSVHSSPVGLECVPQQTFFHWNGLAQSWAGRSNPLGPSLHA